MSQIQGVYYDPNDSFSLQLQEEFYEFENLPDYLREDLREVLGSSDNYCPLCYNLSDFWIRFQKHATFSVHLDISAASGCPTCKLLKQVLSNLIPLRDGQRLGWLKWDEGYHWRPKWHYATRSHATNWWLEADEPPLTIGLCSSEETDLGNPLSLPKFGDLPASTLSDQCMAQISQWVNTCINTHPTCKIGGPYLPNRILDVGNRSLKPDIRLLESPDIGWKEVSSVTNILDRLKLPVTSKSRRPSQDQRYIALSHCWGSSGPRILTTTNSIQANKKCIRWSELPRTFQDAVSVTRRLGIRYLWIDSLCIIQDSIADWAKECPQMGLIYRNSYLTLAAASSKDSDAGLFERIEDLCRQVRLSYEHGKGSQATVIASLRRPNPLTAPDKFPLMSRGWALQERFLAGRVVYFTNEIIFECCTSIMCSCKKDHVRWPCSFAAEDIGYLTKRKARHEIVTKTEQNLAEYWEALVEYYSRLELSFQKDKLPAISGIATEIRRSKQCRYLAGMWEDTLRFDLGWRSHYGGQMRPVPKRAPTWSWASIDTPVSFSTRMVFKDENYIMSNTVVDTRNRRLKNLQWSPEVFVTEVQPFTRFDSSFELHIEILNADISLAGMDETGEVLSGCLTIDGLVGCFKLTPELEGVRINEHHFFPDCIPDMERQHSCLWLASNNSGHLFLILEALEDGIFERIGLVIIPRRTFPNLEMPTSTMRRCVIMII